MPGSNPTMVVLRVPTMTATLMTWTTSLRYSATCSTVCIWQRMLFERPGSNAIKPFYVRAELVLRCLTMKLVGSGQKLRQRLRSMSRRKRFSDARGGPRRIEAEAAEERRQREREEEAALERKEAADAQAEQERARAESGKRGAAGGGQGRRAGRR